MKEPIKILVVDDNADLLETLSIILKRKGFDVATAGDGRAAVDRCEADSYDVVLMDVVMPEMNGFEAFKKIRELGADAPVILMTAYSDDTVMQNAVREGVNSIVNKPFNVDAMIRTLQDLGSYPPVLIVDDDDDILDTLGRTLDRSGYDIALARSGEEAVEMASGTAFKLAFLDIKLPRMDGLETFLRLKEIHPDLNIVLMTGFGDEVREALEKAQQREAVTCLFKPFDPDNAVLLAEQCKKKTRERHGV